MAITWRFFADSDQRWRWEKISTVTGVTRSSESYDTYSDCTAAAESHGYVFVPAPPKIGRTPSLNTRNPSDTGSYPAADRHEAMKRSREASA